MKKWIMILSVLLSVQVGLAALLNMNSNDYNTFQPKEKLLAFDAKKVDSISVASEKNSVELKLRDGKWSLPENDDFPADQSAVSSLLDKLTTLQKGWPVATTGEAAQHFKVADDNFERKLTLSAGGNTVATLYVGTSPGFRKVHVRPAGEDSIYSVAFNTWEANAESDDWIDKEVLKLDAKTIQRLEMPGIVLMREGDTLQLTGLDDKHKTNEQEANSLLDKLANLHIESLLGKQEKLDYQQDKPVFEVKLTQTGGEELDYLFSKPKVGSYFVLKRSDLAEYFKVADLEVDPIKDKVRNKLVQRKSQQKPEKPNGESTTSSVPTDKSPADS